ncbi:helix-turn-helix domain-containing protein [Enterobacteriaceae bacterium YMB-R22]|jgi:hypothetical protein|uniref:STY4528 family pathogenicity island replication protein n=1 Tax=Tenebrionicola larvae TaxID=2815733 RepID=UPI002012CCB5|nr:STY4528 family pathogenicity island replication protein [Tenebrionicola larvae]MBV4413502.1 helix-turn-helix domain-containing protein [Tenebrionicola larvae]
MALALDNVIEHTLSKMTARIVQKTQSGAAVNEQSGLLYLGNVHDAIPRQLYLDSRLSPLDKTAWVMIRLYAQQNEGAVFPTYEELQMQLASPHSGKASRETVSRALLMLRLTGWLSLCKRVRDSGGRVRGNIYAQHDEPLGFRDAEYFDPGWLDAVAQACLHSNKTIRLTALAVLNDIKQDKSMRHRHSRLALIAARMASPQTPQEFVLRQAISPGSDSELSQKNSNSGTGSPSSDSELSINQEGNSPGSETELSRNTRAGDKVRKPNRYVRSDTQYVKDTYVGENRLDAFRLYWPLVLTEKLTTADRDSVEPQLQVLSELGQQVLDDVAERVSSGEIKNVIAYLLATLKRARNGQFNVITGTARRKSPPIRSTENPEPPSPPVPQERQRASAEHISRMMDEIRQAYQK